LSQNASIKSYSWKTDFLPGKMAKCLKVGFSGITFFWVHFVTKLSLYFWNLRKKTDLLIPIMTYFEKKNFGPLLQKVKPNLTLLEQSSASAWILDLEFKKKIFLGFPGPPQTRYSPSFLIFKKS
jgi:hypothetical protein